MDIKAYLRDRKNNRIKSAIKDDLIIVSQGTISLNNRLKRYNNEKIVIVFVCHRPQVWGALKTVFDACVDDDLIEPIIVAIPNKKQLPGKQFRHEEYISEGAEEFFKDYPCRVINGYNYESGEWFDIRRLRPDYVFVQTPYDVCKPNLYKSESIALYAKLCYVHYGMPFMGGMIAEESFPKGFLSNVYMHFAEFPEMKKFYDNRVPDNLIHKKANNILTGYPKLDLNREYEGTTDGIWLYTGEQKKYRVMWTPRWNTEEKNCTFFDFKDTFVDYAKNNSDVELLFRPHPQAFLEYIARKQMTESAVDEYLGRYEKLDNASVDNHKDYLQSFYSADVLVTDESSIIPEYFLTGKPMIFTYKQTHLNEFAKKVSEGFYWAKNWSEVESYIEMLRRGEDPLKEKRQEIIKNEFFLPEKGAGYEIKECIKRDFYEGAK